MSKTKGSGKVHWATIDKRVRDRQGCWNASDLQELDTQLAKLPDSAEQAEIIDVIQPAITRREQAAEGQAGSDGTGSPDGAGDGAAAAEGTD